MTRIPVFRAGGQLPIVRFVMLLSLVALVGTTSASVNLVKHYGQSPGDGGVLKPLPERIAVGALVLSLGAAFAGGMWLYGKFYVASIDLDDGEDQLYLNTVEFLGTKSHQIGLSNILDRHDRSSKVDLTALAASSIAVNNSWKSVQLRGWRLPAIVDPQGDILHPELFEQLFCRK